MSNPHISPAAGSPSGIIRKITPNSSADLADGIPRCIVSGTAGTLNFTDASGAAHTAFPLQVGYNPICPVRVSTGGTATDLWALY